MRAQPALPAVAVHAPPALSALAVDDLASADVTPTAGEAAEASYDARAAADTSGGLTSSDRLSAAKSTVGAQTKP